MTEETKPDSAEIVDAAQSHSDKEHGSFIVTVRTPAGFAEEFRVTEATRVETLTRKAVAYFISHNELADGNYRLVLLTEGTSADLTASARLGESGVEAGAVLALVTTDPQVDG